MGNRAVITTAPYDENNVGIYLHWNGGRASIEGFLLACKRLSFCSPGADGNYALARLTSAIAAYFGADDGGLPVGIGPCSKLDTDNGDNGVYLIDGDWEIVGRDHFSWSEEIDERKTARIAYLTYRRLKAGDAVGGDANTEDALAWVALGKAE